ncbi:hypothetical protein FQN54_008948 [Arachnomyces sp. PD_36]|nr:hypothetical protein FQN54_008948 [Arachnomyces sp. PD_36]
MAAVKLPLAALAATSLFGLGFSLPGVGIGARQTNNTDLCNLDIGLSNDDADQRAKIWNDYGVGKWFDEWLIENGEEDWVRNLDNEIFPSGDSTFDCGSLESDCDMDRHCDQYQEAGYPEAYWVMMAATRAFAAFSYMDNAITAKTLIQSLDIASVVEDFDIEYPAEDINILSMMAGAMVVASGPIGLAAPTLSAGLTVGIGSLSMASQFQQDQIDPTSDLEQQLKDSYTATREEIENTLRRAFVNGSPDSGDLSNLGSGYTTATANWFVDGRWLLSDVNNYLKPMVDEFATRARHGLVNTAMKANIYIMLVNTDVGDECESQDNGAVWMEGLSDGEDGQCYNLFYVFPEQNVARGQDAEDDVVTNMVDNYGIDLAEMYTNVWECAIANPDGGEEFDGSYADWEGAGDGALPPCFWNFGVLRASYNADDNGYYFDDDEPNTLGLNTDCAWC